MWARAGTKIEQETMADADWSEMWTLFQQLQLIEKNLASSQFAATAQQKLKDATRDESLQRAILAYVVSGE
jgi:hypothetical protein